MIPPRGPESATQQRRGIRQANRRRPVTQSRKEGSLLEGPPQPQFGCLIRSSVSGVLFNELVQCMHAAQLLCPLILRILVEALKLQPRTAAPPSTEVRPGMANPRGTGMEEKEPGDRLFWPRWEVEAPAYHY